MQAWENFLKLQEAELGIETVRKWLRTLKVIRFDACNLYLEAKDSFQALWFEEHIRQKVQTKLVNNNNKRIKVHLSIFNAATHKINKTKTSKPKEVVHPPPKFFLNFDDLNPYCKLEHFIFTEKNHLTHKVLCNVAGWNAETNSPSISPPELAVYNPVYIYGSAGTGKTHLLMSLAHALRAKGLNVIYSRAETFTEHVVTAIRAGEMSIFRQAYRNIDVLLIDDVHVFSRKGATQEELFHTFNTLHIGGKQIILSANCLPSELQLIEPRLVSRFEWGIVLALEPLNSSEVRLLLEKKSATLGYPLHPKVAEFLLETFKSSTKILNKALEALILRSHLNQSSALNSSSLTVPQAKQLLSDLILEEQKAALTPDKIIQTIAEFFGIRPEDILGKAQSRDCVLPRQMAMHFCRNQLKMPFMKIGDLFSKDHSTVMSSVKQIQKGIDADDAEITSTYNAILKNLKN